MPEWLQTVLLTILLLFVINKTARKGLNQWRMEKKQRNKQQQGRGHLHDHDSNDNHDEDDDDDIRDHDGHGHRGILHEESFHGPAKRVTAQTELDEAVQAAVLVVDKRAHSTGRYLKDAWQRLPALKVKQPEPDWVQGSANGIVFTSLQCSKLTAPLRMHSQDIRGNERWILYQWSMHGLITLLGALMPTPAAATGTDCLRCQSQLLYRLLICSRCADHVYRPLLVQVIAEDA